MYKDDFNYFFSVPILGFQTSQKVQKRDNNPLFMGKNTKKRPFFAKHKYTCFSRNMMDMWIDIHDLKYNRTILKHKKGENGVFGGLNGRCCHVWAPLLSRFCGVIVTLF